MPQFEPINYFLVLFTIVAFYPIGKRLGVKPFFTATLVGLGFAGMVVAILANFCAGLIYPFLITAIFICFILTIWDIKSIHKIFIGKYKYRYLLLILIGAILLIGNNPSRVFLEKQGDITYLQFNDHYSYFSSQSTEMLNARYFSRLKISNLYPDEWSRYHFFNSGVRAASMALVKTPGLFSYWIAETILSILVILSFAEILFYYFGFKLKNVIIFLIWLVIGFTFFSDAITWNFYTTGLISVFAMVLFLILIYFRAWRQAIVTLFILGASAFRLLLITLFVIIFLIYYFVKNDSQEQPKLTTKYIHSLFMRLKLNLIDYLAIFLFIAYNCFTILSAQNSPLDEKYSLFADRVFNDGWLFPLFFYKVWGFVSSRIIILPHFFQSYNSLGFFSKTYSSSLYILILSVILALLALFWLANLVKYIASNFRVGKWILIIGGTLCLEARFISKDLASLYLLLISYFLAVFVFLYPIDKKLNPKNNSVLSLTSYFIIFITFLFLHFGMPFSIKGPITYITFDIILWTVFGIWLFAFSYKRWPLIASAILALALISIMNVPIFSMLRLPSSDAHYSKIDISPLVSNGFRRSDYVNNNNFMIFTSGDSKIDDAYSTVLGGNYDYSKDHSTFINNSFISKGAHE